MRNLLTSIVVQGVYNCLFIWQGVNIMEYLNIGRVAELTGIPPITLRAWERRYGLPKPQRTASGHRLYSMAEVAQLQRVSALMANGSSISRAVARIREEGVINDGNLAPMDDRWQTFRFRLHHAIEQYDTSAIEQTYNEAISLFPIDLVIDKVMLPLLEQLGEEWDKLDDGIAREHFFSAYLRNKIGARFSHEISRVQGPALLLSCLPGESHELGLILFGLTATARNYRVLYFGADLPISQIMPVASRVGPLAVVLSGSYVKLNDQLKAELTTLASSFPGPVYLGGEVSEHYHESLEGIGVIPVGRHFRKGAETILRVKHRR